MEERDIITVKNNQGEDEQVELILTVNKNKKKYLLYRNKDNEIFASYIIENNNRLYNDLTEEEYKMLENIYQKGSNLYDK